MGVYVLAQMSIHDRQRYEGYAKRFLATLAGMEGRLIAADESVRVIEGEWGFDKVVLLEFSDERAYETWARSPAYTGIATDRLASTTGNVLLVRGITHAHNARQDP